MITTVAAWQRPGAAIVTIVDDDMTSDTTTQIRRKQHIRKDLIVMPKFGTQTIEEREIKISLPHVSFIDGPILPTGQEARK